MTNLESKTIRLRLVEESDAAFILKLRHDDRYNKYLSSAPSDLAAQLHYIRSYKQHQINNEQFYFIIEKLDGTPCGTVRVYDLRQDSFAWGSWILNEEKTRFAAIESAFLVYAFGFSVLKMEKSHFEVMKGNDGVISFHEKMGAYRISEDAENVYFEITKDIVSESRRKFQNKLL